MMMDREKEREIELETAMYTNCLLLGLDPNVIGVGSNRGPVRAGHFSHSNPKLGEQLLYFILSSLRGPVQSTKDFHKVWPIFDSAQSRDFRKVVQGIISELESQGALPRSNSRVSSLATCCGTRFVELLWQLSLHAVREVHRRAFAADVASSPLPAPLTDVAFSHAATLLPVTKARIALERRRFLKNAETAVQRQASWSSLAHEMTAEFRGLCAEEAYLQQELEKLHNLRNKVKLEGEHWDELVSSSSQNSQMVQRATRLWDSLLSRKSQHEVLASGPIEDLIAHREHRYRISGSSLLAAMDQSSVIQSINLSHEHSDDDEIEGSQADIKDDKHKLDSSLTHENEEFRSRGEEMNMRGQPTVDIAEVLRRWTHALQRIHKQSLQLAKANNGEGPELLRNTQGDGSGSHAESLTATLAEHRQHLESIQVLIDQFKDVAPLIQSSISELTEEVNSLSAKLPPVMKNGSNSAIQGSVSGDGEILDMTSRLSSVQLDKTSANPQTLKLPPLFSSTPNLQKHPNLAHTNPVGIITEKNSLNKAHSNGCVDSLQQDEHITSMQNLKRSVREAALSYKSLPKESPQGSRSDDSYEEHFFVPLSGTGFSHFGQDKKLNSLISRQVSNSQADSSLLQTYANDNRPWRKHHGVSDMLNDLDSFDEFNGVNGLHSTVGSNSPVSEAYKSFYDDESPDQVFSPPLLMDTALLAVSYEDLLAPLSDIEFETALMRH